MKPSPKLKVNQQVVVRLRRALSAARMENCGVEEEHKEAMRLYLHSWVVHPIEAALDSILGLNQVKAERVKVGFRARCRAAALAAEMIEGAISAGDEWTWKNEKGEEDRDLTEALHQVAAELAYEGRHS